jgi:signal transduction histidine kinase
MQRIALSISAVSALVVEIAAASGQQAQEIQTMHASIDDMDRSTQQNAALVEQAAAAEYVKKVGPDAAIKSFETDKTRWVVKDLSVWVMDAKGVMKYHENAKMVGKDLSELKDANGRFFTKEFMAVGAGKSAGSVTYEWAHPQTRKLTTKTAYLQPAGNDVFVGVSVSK